MKNIFSKLILTTLFLTNIPEANAATIRVPFEVSSQTAGAGKGMTSTMSLGDYAVGMTAYAIIDYKNNSQDSIVISKLPKSTYYCNYNIGRH